MSVDNLADLMESLDKMKTAIAISRAEEKRLKNQLKSDFDIESMDDALDEAIKIEPEILELTGKRDKLVESANKLIQPLLGLLDG